MKSMLGLCIFPSTHTRFVFICLVLFACLIPITGNVQASTNWSSEYLFRQDNFELSGQNTLLFDAQNNPWIFLSGDTVQAMHHAGNEWITHEISDSPAIGICAILNDTDQPVICFTDQKTRNVKLATFSGSTWNAASVDTSGTCVESVGLIQDSTGCLHVFFIKSQEGEDHLVHLYNSSEGWQSEVVYTEGLFYGNIAAIETTPGVIGIAFITWHSNLCQVLYMNPVTPEGAVETVASTGTFQNFSAVKLVKDSTGQCRILAAYGSRGGPARLLYGYRHESGWITEYPFDAVMPVNDPGMEILIDSSDVSHLFFTSEQNMVHAWKVEEQWNSETQLLEGGDGGSIAAGYDRMGRLRTAIVVNRTTEDENLLYYGAKELDDWALNHIKTGGGELDLSSVCTAPDGTIYVAFSTRAETKLITRRNGITQVETIQALCVPYGTAIDLALDPSGNPGIVTHQYTDGSPGNDIVLWERQEGVWSPQIVRSTPEGSFAGKLVYAADGVPHIVYYESNLNNQIAMHHAFETPEGWVDQVVDLGNTSALQWVADVDLERSADGVIHFFSVDSHYVDHQQINSMRYGTLGDSGWVVESRTIDIGDVSSSSVTLAFDNLGNPHAVFKHGSLFYTTRTDSDWTIEEIAQIQMLYRPGLMTAPDGTLWVSAAGAWDEGEHLNIWKKQADWTIEYYGREIYPHVDAALLAVPGSLRPSCLETRIIEGDILLLSPMAQPDCTEWETSASLNATHFTSGMPFHFDLEICNPSDPLDSAVVVSCLEIQGEYFFHPSWSQSFDFEPLSVPSGWTTVPILHFTFPDPITFSIESLHLYGALLRPDLSEVLGPIWQQEFSIGPE